MAREVSYPGIHPRVDATGRTRYFVRVRRKGTVQSATLPTFEEAIAWHAQALAAAEGKAEAPTKPIVIPSVPADAPPSVRDACRRLCKAMVDGTARARNGGKYKPSTIRSYEENLREDVIPRIGDTPIDLLTRGDIQRLADDIARDKSTQIARKAITALRVVLKHAVRYALIDASPATGISLARDDEDEERPARIITPAEFALILQAAERDDARFTRSFAGPLVDLLGCGGVRLGEALGAPWGKDGIDLDAGVIRVRRSLDRVRDENGRFRFVPPKSKASRRDVPLPPETIARLRRHRLATGRPAEGQLVFSSNGESVTPSLPRAMWERIINHGDLPNRAKKKPEYQIALSEPVPRLHDLRHAYATWSLAAGLSAHAVAELMGHADPSLVWQRYGHALPAELSSAGEKLSAWIAANDR